jgi:hypothetical protein
VCSTLNWATAFPLTALRIHYSLSSSLSAHYNLRLRTSINNSLENNTIRKHILPMCNTDVVVKEGVEGLGRRKRQFSLLRVCVLHYIGVCFESTCPIYAQY